MNHSPVLAEDLRTGDKMTNDETLSTLTITSHFVWASGDVAIEVAERPGQAWHLKAGTLVWIVDPLGEPHPAESSEYVRIRRRDALDLVMLIEDTVEDLSEVEADAVRRVSDAAHSVE